MAGAAPDVGHGSAEHQALMAPAGIGFAWCLEQALAMPRRAPATWVSVTGSMSFMTVPGPRLGCAGCRTRFAVCPPSWQLAHWPWRDCQTGRTGRGLMGMVGDEGGVAARGEADKETPPRGERRARRYDPRGGATNSMSMLSEEVPCCQDLHCGRQEGMRVAGACACVGADKGTPPRGGRRARRYDPRGGGQLLC